MTRYELVSLTLDQLIEAFNANPECFDLETPEIKSFSTNVINDSIMWKHRVEIDKSYISDPNNPARTIIIVHNRNAEEIQCHIYLSNISSINNAMSNKADADISCHTSGFSFFDKNYKKFKKLKNMIIDRDKNREHDKFLSKLYSIFPGTFDDHIFGKK